MYETLVTICKSEPQVVPEHLDFSYNLLLCEMKVWGAVNVKLFIYVELQTFAGGYAWGRTYFLTCLEESQSETRNKNSRLK
jgi:hypothetical protein